jgi:carbon-monoxide dehydrogenase medium subunit
MKPAAFSYHAPKTIDEAVALLAEVAPDDGRVLAGGQSLVPTMAFRLARPAHLVDINGVEGLDRLYLDEDGDGDELSIGALVRHAAFDRPVVDSPLGPLLSHVARHIGHYPIRQRGTFCGSLAQADPASEWCLTAVTLDATMTAMSSRGSRTIQARDFIEGIMTTVLEDDELLTEARLPIPRAGTRFGFSEFNRVAGGFAVAMVLTAYRLEDGVITEARIGVGGVEERPRRLAVAESALEGRTPDAQAFQAAAEAAAGAVDPMEDINTSADYRRDLLTALTLRALEQAAT